MADDFVQVRRQFTTLEKVFIALLVLLIVEVISYYAVVVVPTASCHSILDHAVLVVLMLLIAVTVLSLYKRNQIGLFTFVAVLVVICSWLVFDFDEIEFVMPSSIDWLLIVQLVVTGSLAVVVAVRFRRKRFLHHEGTNEEFTLRQADQS